MFFKNKQSSCGWGGSCSPSVEGNKEKSNNTRIKILGTGCANCTKLEANTLEAVKEMGIDLDVGHVQDMAQIAAYGVMSTPALVLDEKVLSYGKVLSKDEIIKILKENIK